MSIHINVLCTAGRRISSKTILHHCSSSDCKFLLWQHVPSELSALGGMEEGSRVLQSRGRALGLWSSWVRKLQGVVSTVRLYPSTVIVPLLVFAALTAVGVAITLLASNAQADASKRQASLDATAATELMAQLIHGMVQPMHSMAVFIASHPHYPAVLQQFPNLTTALMEQVEGLDASSYLELSPMAHVVSVYPENVNSITSVGLDLLNSTRTLHNLEQRLTLVGPLRLLGENVLGMIGAAVIMVPGVERNETFGMPPSLQKECPPVLESRCYDEPSRSKFWGIVYSVMYMESFVLSPSAALAALREKGYDYVVVQDLPAPTPDEDPDPPSGPVIPGPNGTEVVLLARSEGDLTPDPVSATVRVESVAFFIPWTLMVTRSGGWGLPYKTYLIATVVVVAAIIAALLFILLSYMRQHQMLLFALVPRKMVKSLFQDESFGNVEQLSSAGARIFDAGTPMERLMDILSQFIMGRAPEVQDVVALRVAILHGGKALFEPQNLRERLELNKDLPDDVVEALVRQLQGRGPENRTDPQAAPASEDSEFGFLPGGGSFSVMSVALERIIRTDSRSEPKTCGHSPALSSWESADRIVSTRSAVNLLGTGYTSSPRSSVPSRALLEEMQGNSSKSNTLVQRDSDHEVGDIAAVPSPSRLPVKLPGPQPVSKVEQLLEAAYGSWTFNAFELSEATNGHPLSVTLFFLLSRSGLMRDMKLKPSIAARLSLAIEDGYCPNPYHNKIHAADVLQTMHTILVNSGMVVAAGQKGYCPPETLLACLLAAAGHDMGHTGVTNDFLIQSEDQLATLYSDRSPMEHHHLARLWALLRSPGLDILSHLPKEERTRIRKTVIDLISATDMKNHFSMLSQFSVVHQLSGNNPPADVPNFRRPSIAAAAARISDSASTTTAKHPWRHDVQCLPLDDAEQILSLQIALKCADLGHIAETPEVHCRWVGCLEEEFFAQGDRERSLGLPISPLFDRNKPGASKSQVGFYDFVVLPLFHNFCCAFPGAKPMVDLTLTTYKYWKAMAAPVDGRA